MRVTGPLSEEGPFRELEALRHHLAETEGRVASLSASERRYRELVDNACDIVYALDLDGAIVSINPALEAIAGYRPEDVIGWPVERLIAPEYRELARAMLEQKLSGAPATEYEVELAAKDGRRVPVSIRSALILDGGRPAGVQGIARDITERKRLETALRRGEDLFHLVVQATSDAVWDWDLRSDSVLWNLGLDRFGYSSDGKARDPLWHVERIHPSDSVRVNAKLQAAIESAGSFWSEEYRFRRADGTYAQVVDRAYILRNETGRAVRVVGTLADVSERKQAEDRLRESAEQFQILFQHHPQPMFVYDRETLEYLEVNEAAVAKYGYSREEFLRMTVTDLRPPEEIPRLLEFLGHCGPSELNQAGEWVHVTKDGRRLDVEVVGHHLPFAGRPAALIVASDITERKVLQEQLQHSQRMEAVGRLAGGIAHDFNNLLTIITGYCQMLQARADGKGPVASSVAEIRKAADRATALTQQLLAFSRRQVIRPRLLDLNSVVRDMDQMLRHLVGDAVQVSLQLSPDLGAVNADPVQMEQILLNLAANSRDAMPQGGILSVTTENFDVRAASVDGKGRPGRYIRISVSDTGHGMDPETRSHLFEPFFTTKGEGKGTGLGLSTVYGIVEQNGGHISVSTERGAGTTFQVYLPRVLTAADDAAPDKGQKPGWGEETVLLVEDETGVRRLIAETLRASGYQVIEADSPAGALHTAASHLGPIHLLLTDVALPEMTGIELAGRLLSQRPETKVLYVSGSYIAAARQATQGVGAGFLQKPFSGEILGRTVRSVLDGAPHTAGSLGA
jgi:hypothetical protein